MLSPSDYLNQSNFSGQFSLPLFTPYSLLTLNNTPNSPFIGDNPLTPIGDHTLPQGSLDPNATGTPQSLNTITDALGVTGWLSTYFKDMALISLALVLLVLGLYMLANSTKTGNQIISVGKDAALKAAIA